MDCRLPIGLEKDIITHKILNQQLKMQSLKTTLPGLISAVQAAQSGSFSGAAQVLSLTPAAVSKNVAALEAHLKVRLFNRTTRRLSLTEEGRAFVAQARVGLQALEDANALATQGGEPEGLVRVNCAVGFGRHYVLPALPELFARHSKLEVELSLNDQQTDLVAAGFDIGIRGGTQPPLGMVARKICDLPVILVATPRYLRDHGTPQSVEDLLLHRLIRVRFQSGRMPPWTFRESPRAKSLQSIDPPAQLLISDPEAVLDAALLHMGIARMSRHHAHDALKRGALIEVLPKLHGGGELNMSLFYPHRAGLAPRVRVVADHLMASFAKNPALKR
jgi:DNA-binding transcriptional LysR family regulator